MTFSVLHPQPDYDPMFANALRSCVFDSIALFLSSPGDKGEAPAAPFRVEFKDEGELKIFVLAEAGARLIEEDSAFLKALGSLISSATSSWLQSPVQVEAHPVTDMRALPRLSPEDDLYWATLHREHPQTAISCKVLDLLALVVRGALRLEGEIKEIGVPTLLVTVPEDQFSQVIGPGGAHMRVLKSLIDLWAQRQEIVLDLGIVDDAGKRHSLDGGRFRGVLTWQRF